MPISLHVGVRVGGILGGGGAPAPTPTPAPISASSSDGAFGTMIVPADLTFAPIQLSRQGFDSTGAPTTFAETFYTTKRRLAPYPTSSGYASKVRTADGAVAYNDFLYKTDTVLGSNPVNTSGNVDSPKPVAQWLLVDKQVVGNTITQEVYAQHRDGVACVELVATDGTTTVTTKVSTRTKSTRTTDLGPVLVYALSLDISTLANPADITVNCNVYPKTGGSASVLHSADLTTSNADRRLFSPRTYRRDTAKAAAVLYVAVADSVAGGGSTTPAVSTDPLVAEATPATTLAVALQRIQTLALSYETLRVRLKGKVVPSGAAPTTLPSVAPTTEIIIEPATGVSKAAAIVEWGAASAGYRVPFVRYRGITFNRVGTAASPVTSTAGYHAVWEDCAFDNQNRNAALGSGANTGSYFNGVTVTNAANGLFPAGNCEVRMLRGVDLTPAVAGTITKVECYNVHGCIMETINSDNASARNDSGRTMSGNIFYRISGSIPIQMNAGGNVVGAFFEQNVFEFNSASSATSLAISSDGASINTNHVGIIHNTFAGFWNWGRVNFFYDETDNVFRAHTLHRDWGNIYVSVNTKHSIFAGVSGVPGDPSLRTGGDAYLHGVGSGYNFMRYTDAGETNFAQEYAGAGSVVSTSKTGAGLDPKFTNYQAANDNGGGGANAGTGRGTYSIAPDSPCKNAAPVKPWTPPFDMAGSARSGTTSIGAYA